MRTSKKILAVLLALIMVTALGATAFADGTITINPPTTNPSSAANTYTIYKIFDASVSTDGTKVSYTLPNNQATPPAATGFTVDAQSKNVSYTGSGTGGELTAAEIEAIKNYVTSAGLVGTTVQSTGTAAAVSETLPNGYYYITTSTGTLVTINTNKNSVTVNDKNTPPSHKKEITYTDAQYGSFDAAGKNAIAQVGTQVGFTHTITVGKGMKNYTLNDTLGAGLDYIASTLQVNGGTIKSQNYDSSTRKLTVVLNDGLAEGATVTISYKATINSTALNTNFEKNTANVGYGNDPSVTKTPDVEVKVYDAKILVNKKDNTGAPLAGAGFVLKNSSNQYYKLVNNVVTWVGENDTPDVHTSATDGVVPAFTGLGSGTYTLVEKVVPAGFNKAPDKAVTIAAAASSSDGTLTTPIEVTSEVTNNPGTVLPTTGGIGTTIFYVLGSCLLLGAAVLMITRRRMGREG